MDFISILRGIIGIALILGISFLLSNNKKKINWRLVLGGLGIQFVLAIFIIKGDDMRRVFSPLGWFKDFFTFISSFFVSILQFSEQGASFVFGNLGLNPAAKGSLGFFFAFQVLPTIIFFAALMSVLYYLGVMQRVVRGIGWFMTKFMGASGAESLNCAANIFVGQTEAPLMIKPYIKNLTQSELLTVMIAGMATISGGVMAAYIQMLSEPFALVHNMPVLAAQQIFATHLLASSVIAAPGSLIIAKMLFPETGDPETKGTIKVKIEKGATNLIGAASSGASDGLSLALNVGAMLITFIAFIFMLNQILLMIGDFTHLNVYLQANFNQPLSFQLLLGLVLQWIGVGIGIPMQDALNFGKLFGTKIILNEFVAYADFKELIKNVTTMSPKSVFMITYALCGFANISSIGIQVGGIGPLAPERRSDLAKLGVKALIGGSLTTLLGAALAGIFL